MYNVTTIGQGLGRSSSAILAWGLGSWIRDTTELLEDFLLTFVTFVTKDLASSVETDVSLNINAIVEKELL